MGYISTATTTTIVAKLTPYGRAALVSNNNNLITSFSLGDSDANYYATLPLTSGQVPAEAGDIGANTSLSNSTAQNADLKSVLIVSGNGILRKPVELNSSIVTTESVANGQVTVSANSLTQTLVNRNNYATDSLVNLYYSFGLPVNYSDDNKLTGITTNNGGFSDTSLSGLAQSNILVVAIKNSTYGESIDGKEINFNLVTSAGTFSIYSTFQNKGASLASEDANIRDTAAVTSYIDSNIAFLFSDSIMKPNGGDPTLSWGTGFGSTKPFSLNSKRLWNLQTNSTLGASADTIVGIAYLDKGFVVITHPTIVSAFTASASSASTLTFNSVSTAVYQNITCIANRGEFISSTNKTFGRGDSVRISEIGLFDKEGRLVAIGKSDRQIIKNLNSPLYLGVKISL